MPHTQVAEFVRAQMSPADLRRRPVEPAAMALLERVTGGVPRDLRIVARLAAFMSGLEDADAINEDHVRSAGAIRSDVETQPDDGRVPSPSFPPFARATDPPAPPPAAARCARRRWPVVALAASACAAGAAAVWHAGLQAPPVEQASLAPLAAPAPEPPPPAPSPRPEAPPPEAPLPRASAPEALPTLAWPRVAVRYPRGDAGAEQAARAVAARLGGAQVEARAEPGPAGVFYFYESDAPAAGQVADRIGAPSPVLRDGRAAPGVIEVEVAADP